MASNSDSIFNLLSYLKRHPKERYIVKSHCTNVVQIFVKDTVKVSDADIYFPDNKLMVNRLEDSFLEQHGSLLDYYWQKKHRLSRNLGNDFTLKTAGCVFCRAVI